MSKSKSSNMFRNVLCSFFVVLSVLYAAPNFFDKEPAVGIIAKQSGVSINSVKSDLEKIKEEIKYEKIIIKNNELSVVFNSISDQMDGYEVINKKISNDYYKNINLMSSQPAILDYFKAKPASLGLDLRGGVHFLMEIDTEELMVKKVEAYSKSISDLINEKSVIENEKIIITNNKTNLKKINDNYFETFDINVVSEKIEISIKQSKENDFIDSVVKQNIITLHNRVNEIGVAEPTIQRQGLNRIIVQLPGIQDTAKAKEIIGATATLDFRAVDESSFFENENNKNITTLDGTASYLFKKEPIISGQSIIDANSGFDPESGSSIVSVTLDSEGGNKMLAYTSENQGKLMGSILRTVQYNSIQLENGEIEKTKNVTESAINVANINGTFSNRFQITGLDDKGEAHKLAILLRSGALAAPVEIIEERTIGPNMGADNIAKGKLSILIGFIFVLVIMGVRYKTLGLIANVCVFINMFSLLAILSVLGATLTLPGIAGIILTVGMAVDANVVIFERIKEEYNKKGKVLKSIENGYGKALSSILDANITTFIAALVLFSIGSGAIKGFAVTLLLGIITSLITTIFLSKAIVEIVYKNKKTINF